jgi:hypothetical protein
VSKGRQNITEMLIRNSLNLLTLFMIEKHEDTVDVTLYKFLVEVTGRK